MSRFQELKAVSKMGIRYKLYILGAEIPLRTKCKGEKLYSSKKLLKGDSTMLPLGVTWEVSYLFYNQNIELTEEQTELLSLIEVVKKKRNEFLGECEILKSEYEKNTTETGILIENKIVAKENIALEKEIFVE